VAVAVVVALLAGIVVWRSAGRDAEPAAKPATSPASPSASPSPSPSPSAVAELSTGSWLLSLSGGSGLYLTVDGDFAALSTSQRTVFVVVKGLADASCFSIRAPNGKYLRHFDFRLRFDDLADSDLFHKDATFCPLSDAPAGAVLLRSVNYPDHVIHSRGNQLYIDKRDGSTAFDADSSFTLEDS
jgi:hypothetical protein